MNKISIGFTGDFCPWLRMEEAFFSNKWKEALEPAKNILEKNDINIIDLECPLTNSNQKIIKTGPHISSNPKTAEILSYLNCKYVVTANNHFKDYGWNGIKDSYAALNKNDIKWLGSGKDINEASKPIIIEKNGLKIGVVNMTEFEWSIAGTDEFGCNPIDLPNILKVIQELKKENKVNFVLTIIHGGHEHFEFPSPRMKSQFRFMVDAGADAVIGHHTHIVSGYEIYKNKPIFYSLGNFCFDWPNLRNTTWNIGLILKLTLEKNKDPSFQYTFINQNNDAVGVSVLNKTDLKIQETKIEYINRIIEDDRLLEDKFNEFARNKKRNMLTSLQPYRNRWLVALNKRGFLPDILGKRKKQLLQALIQCESHREVLLKSLNRKNV